jgi:heme/copper-type cytochrome/quinol oxidase subunit 2
MHRQARKVVIGLVGGLVGVGIVASYRTASAARPQGQVREITIVGDQFAFAPTRVEVQKDDLVRVKFTAQDVPHSFTIDVPYRISKRAAGGQSVVFEFRADETGRFTYYCNLTQDDRCKQMKGELVVR